MFRIQLLERRERQLFRRRTLQAVAGGAAVLVVSALTVSAGSMAYVAASVLLFALALVTGAVVMRIWTADSSSVALTHGLSLAGPGHLERYAWYGHTDAYAYDSQYR